MGAPVSSPRTSQLKANIEPLLYELFNALAKAENASVSDYIRTLVITELRTRQFLPDKTLADMAAGRVCNANIS